MRRRIRRQIRSGAHGFMAGSILVLAFGAACMFVGVYDNILLTRMLQGAMACFLIGAALDVTADFI